MAWARLSTASLPADTALRDIRERVALEEGLRKQTVELSRGVEVQRTLGEIAQSIVEVDDAGETLQQVVDVSKRLLGSDGAHLTLMDDDGENLIPMVIAGDTDPATRAWLHRQRFPVGGGINGMAAATAKPAWTDDYLADPRLPHDPSDESPARLQLGAVVVAPLFGTGGEVIGTLAITYAQAHNIDPRDVTLCRSWPARARLRPATPACMSSRATRSAATGTWSTTRPTWSGRSMPMAPSPIWANRWSA